MSVRLFSFVSRGWTQSFAFPIARFVLPFFVLHSTASGSSFAAFIFGPAWEACSLSLTFSFSLSFVFIHSHLRRSTTKSRSLKGGVNEAARLSHGRSSRQTGPFSSSCQGEPSYLCELRRSRVILTSRLSMRPGDIISVTSSRTTVASYRKIDESLGIFRLQLTEAIYFSLL